MPRKANGSVKRKRNKASKKPPPKRTEVESPHQLIWSAVKNGNLRQLRHLIEKGVVKTESYNRKDSNKWNILHHAVMSRNLEIVKLLLRTFKIDLEATDNQGLTPLTLACTEQCPIEIITHLMERMKQFRKPSHMKCAVNRNRIEKMNDFYADKSPMKCAVAQSRIDLLKAVIPFEANIRWKFQARVKECVDHVLMVTGDPIILEYLLDLPDGIGLSLFMENSKPNPETMEHYVRCSTLELEKKARWFEMLFSRLHSNPNPTVDCRYNVNDILAYALQSTDSTSLIPYLIETERKWEQRPLIRSLYERLLPVNEMLALMVLCECGPVTIERKHLGPVLEKHFEWFRYLTCLAALYRMVIKELFNDVGPVSTEAMQLLEDFVTFFKTIKLPYIKAILHCSILPTYTLTLIERIDNPIFHRAVECLMILNGETEDIIHNNEIGGDRRKTALWMFPLLRHCVTLPKPSYTNVQDVQDGTENLAWYFMEMFDTWESIQCREGLPQIFPLKRFARDAVRQAVLQGMNETDANSVFFERLESLNLPQALKDYLRYCDRSSAQCAIDFMTQ